MLHVTIHPSILDLLLIHYTTLPRTMNRIQQLDSLLLEDQVASLLHSHLSAFQDKSLPRTIQRFAIRYNDCIKLFIDLILFKLFIIDKNATYADILTNQKLVFPQFGKLAFLAYIFLKHGISRFDTYIPEIIKKLHTLFEFLNSLTFLKSGKFPTILHRISNTSYRSQGISLTSNPESISYEFQDRQLIWSTLSEIASAFTLPSFLKNKRKHKSSSNSEGVVVPKGICPVDQLPVCNPHIVSCCGKEYCYTCALSLIGSECLNCRDIVEKVVVYTEGIEVGK